MSEGRTTYWAKDAAWHRRERIVMLGAEFGPAGPLAIDWLSCEADSQRDAGRVKTGHLAVSRGCFIDDAELARRIVARAVEIGALDDFEDHGLTFTVRVSGWESDQRRAAAARRQRDRRGALSRPVTPGHALSRPVTLCNGEIDEAPAGGGSDAQEPAGALSVVEIAPGAADAPDDGQPGNTGDPAALSRLVTPGHGPSRDVTESHVKTRPDQTIKNKVNPDVSPRLDGSRSQQEQQVFDEWINATGRTGRTVLDANRRRLIRRALTTHPIDDVLDAVRGWRHSPHHRGENDSHTVYNDLELLLRNSAHIEKFRDLERTAGATTTSGQAIPTDEHCSEDDQAHYQWADAVQALDVGDARVLLDGSHPHHSEPDGTLLIGVHPSSYPTLIRRTARTPDWAETLVDRPVRFVACPSLARRSAA